MARGVLMNPVLSELLSSSTVRLASGEQVEIHSHIPPEEGEAIQRLIKEIRPSVSIEVGLAFGISALYICDALSECGANKHIIIDPNQNDSNQWKGIGLDNIIRAGHGGLIEFHENPSYIALPKLLGDGRRAQFAFIDGWHTFDYTLVDFFYIDLILDVGGVVVFDDANFPGVRKVIRYVLTNRDYSVVLSLESDGELRPSTDILFKDESDVMHLMRSVCDRSDEYKSLARDEIAVPDHKLGLSSRSRCVALRKENNYSNSWDFHRRF
jgi:predicted O-methyltransferase YrrM